AGRELKTLAEAAHFARSMIAQDKAEMVILARGADGSLIVSGDDCFTCKPPRVQVNSKVGAGDSFVAALTLGLSRGWDLRRAAQYGTAAAAAACMTPASKLCRLEDVEVLLKKTEIQDV
ncbi:MAG: 1-phosphofructokinase family hexose kinase, partial [Rhodobacteraceae bacterium]|nr:1-phosphofructokinase family hexose kinase [Paracoccaceae bacterium]